MALACKFSRLQDSLKFPNSCDSDVNTPPNALLSMSVPLMIYLYSFNSKKLQNVYSINNGKYSTDVYDKGIVSIVAERIRARHLKARFRNSLRSEIQGGGVEESARALANALCV